MKNEIELALNNLTHLNTLSLYFHQNNISGIIIGLNNLTKLNSLVLFLEYN